MLDRVATDRVSEFLKEEFDCFICYSSFEERCSTVAKEINTRSIKRVYILRSLPAYPQAEMHAENIQRIFSNNAEFVDVRIDQPLYTVDQFSARIIPSIRQASGKVLIDITTFTHEHLLILLYFLNSENLIEKVVFCYTGAKDYCLNTPLKDIWLTKGVKQVRSVVGFPGTPVPSKDLHLIVMVGFEHERAQRLIETYDPARLSLGFAPRLTSVSDELSETNKAFFLRVQQFVNETRRDTTALEEFEFSCVDPIQARDALLRQIGEVSNYNTVICPLNTKISTVGAALAAFTRDDIQLCYAEAAIYNVMNYSSPGPMITFFDLPTNNLIKA